MLISCFISYAVKRVRQKFSTLSITYVDQFILPKYEIMDAKPFSYMRFRTPYDFRAILNRTAIRYFRMHHTIISYGPSVSNRMVRTILSYAPYENIVWTVRFETYGPSHFFVCTVRKYSMDRTFQNVWSVSFFRMHRTKISYGPYVSKRMDRLIFSYDTYE